MTAPFSFHDLHGFKDYVTFVQTYLPDRFHPRENYGPEDQWTLDLAFKGLRLGLRIAVEEKGDKPVFAECSRLVDKAEAEYRDDRWRDGFATLEEVRKLLRKVRTS
ncbi:MAG TPA: hypothetical protein VIB82_08890 [Caulobacteraceae bacterium]|jgi:hypothetical protein